MNWYHDQNIRLTANYLLVDVAGPTAEKGWRTRAEIAEVRSHLRS